MLILETLVIGFVLPIKEGLEFLAQANWAPTQDFDRYRRNYKWRTWTGAERGIAIGLNIMATENLEVITEFGWEHEANQYTIAAGLIYAL